VDVRRRQDHRRRRQRPAWLWEHFALLIRPLQTGRVQNYALAIFGGMLVLVIVIRWVWGA